jgi:hypothetical protein
MNRRASVGVLAALVLLVSAVAGRGVAAQVTYQPTPEPAVTAENERWYLEVEPITYSGAFYYPTGPQVYFNRHEMVRSGSYDGVPIYVRPTIDAFSVVYVPLPGGRMQPYERRREGELAGTTGNVAPSFPVATASEGYREPGPGNVPEAAGPPTFIGSAPVSTAPSAPRGGPAGMAGAPDTSAAEPVGTTGPLASARRPQGLNGIFIEYDGSRWFSSGSAVEFDPGRFTPVGEYRGFTVYAARGDRSGTIYLPVAEGASALLAPYSRR